MEQPQMSEDDLTAEEKALFTFSKVCRNKSPEEFMAWTGCTKDEAIEIYSASFAISYTILSFKQEGLFKD